MATPGPPAPLRHAPEPEWIEAAGGHRIPVRRFGVGGRRRPVVMLHGMQSHSGWFVQSARRIAALGLPVHAFDRCGSGLSRTECDIGPRLARLLDEVDAVADEAVAGRDDDRVHILGHCFGALVALLYAGLHRPARIASLVLATPALYTRTDVPARDKVRIVWSVLAHRPARVPVPFSPEQLCEEPAFLEFIRGDPLSARKVPARLLYEVPRARRLLPRAARALRAPLLVALAGEDPICDNRRNRRLLEEVSAPMEIREYPGARHILEFSRRREDFLDDLAAWFERTG